MRSVIRVLALIAAAGVAQGGTETRTVSFSGWAAPDASGAVFQSFSGPPSINQAGRLAFNGFFEQGVGGVSSTDDAFVYAADSTGGLSLIAQEGQDAIGPDVRFSTFSFPTVGRDGEVAFATSYTGAGVFGGDVFGFHTSDNAMPRLIARAGGPAPGGGTFNIGSGFFPGAVHGGGIGTFAADVLVNGQPDRKGIYRGSDAAALAAVIETGDPAPGIPARSISNLDTLAASANKPLVSSTGAVVFRATLGGGGIEHGIFVGQPGALEVVAHTGAPAPDAAGTGFGAFLDFPAINNRGDVTFTADIAGAGFDASRAIYKTDAGTLKLVAQAGDVMQDAQGGRLGTQIGFVSLGDRGDVAFTGQLLYDFGDPNFANRTAVFATAGGARPRVIAQQGFPAPGLGVDFNTLNTRAAVTNAAGDVAFVAQVGVSRSLALYLFNADTQQLELIAAAGQPFEVSNDPATPDLRTVSGIAFDDFAFDGSDGLSDTRELAYRLAFVGGGEGIFVTRIPSACPADFTGPAQDGIPDGTVDPSDLTFYLDQYIAQFGAAGGAGPNGFNADLSGPAQDGIPDGTVDASDLTFFLDAYVAGFGSCL